MSTIVQHKIDGDIGIITMDDGKVNAFSFEMIKQVNEALDHLESQVKAIILTGREGKFCGGFDLQTMKAGGDGKERLLKEGFQLSYRLMDMAVPVVIACNGHALAYGAVLLLSGDYRIGKNGDYKLGLNEIAIGVEMPQYGVDLVRERVAQPYQIPAMANSILYTPSEAVCAGFLDTVEENEDVVACAHKVASQLSQLDLTAHAKAKRALRHNFLQNYKNL